MVLYYSKRTLLIDTTLTHFAGWLEKHVRSCILPITPDGKHYISIRQFIAPSRCTRPEKVVKPIRLIIGGTYTKPDPECAEAGLMTNVEVITFDVISLNAERIEVTAECFELCAADYFNELVEEIKRTFKTTELSNKNGVSEPTARTQARAEVFKKLKDAHPGWSQAKVAMEAKGELGEDVTSDTVRNVYRSMRNAYGSTDWTWQKSDKI
jgi:hypothetical protein